MERKPTEFTAEANQAEVIAFLESPSTYNAGPVERIDTHASIVFLAGDRAYKLKRAVTFSYLDYSSVELRRQYCEAELALNRRTAPSLYLEVRTVSRDRRGQLHLGGNGAVADWVVVMRRFDQDMLLDHMADRGTLPALLMLDLADRIAAFHAIAEPDPESGGTAGMNEAIVSNTLNLEGGIPRYFEAAMVERVNIATQASLDRLTELLDSRRRDGRVRHCHGDLHLRNICLIDGRPTLFDCIEFSRSIACIDVLYDLAFLLMDLADRGFTDHGNAVLNRYLDLRDELGGLAALPLFMSVRAAIRAHVSAAVADRQVVPPERQRQANHARRYLMLAEELLKPRAPRLVAIGGLSGTGKSTLAYGLAPALGVEPGARVIRSDVVRKRMYGVALADRLPETSYGDDETKHVYDRVISDATIALSAGYCVVADAVFARPAQRRAIAEAARKAGAPFTGFWLEAPIDDMLRRLELRQGDASDATPDVLRRQMTYDLGEIEWQRIAAGGDRSFVLAEVQRRLALSRMA